jgi:hypothetical protein
LRINAPQEHGSMFRRVNIIWLPSMDGTAEIKRRSGESKPSL